MVKLNTGSKKVLTFEIQVGGIQSTQLESYLRIVLDGIEYGFPAEIKDDCVTVEVPPLSKIIPKPLREGEKIEAKLEMIADGYYLEPWKDTIVLSNPVTVEAKIKDDTNSDVEVSLISEQSKPVTKTKKSKKNISEDTEKKKALKELKENLTEEDIYKYMEKAGTKNKKIQEIVYEQASAAASKHTPFEILRQVVKILNKSQRG